MTILDARHQSAIEAVDHWFQASTEVVCLGKGDLKRLGYSRFQMGWRLPAPIDSVQLYLLLDASFPYSLPRVAVSGDSDVLAWPHVEKNGLLCLAGDDARVAALEPLAIVQHCIASAESLLRENAAGGNKDDFRTDFEAYWRRVCDSTPPALCSLVRHAGPSRIVKAWHGKDVYLVAETEADALRWMEGRYGVEEGRTTQSAAVIWLDELPEPASYPATTTDLWRLVRNSSPDGVVVLGQLLRCEPRRAAVVLVGPTLTGRVASAGVELQRPVPPIGKGRRTRAPVSKGFRPGHVPGTVLAARYSMRRLDVERLDAARTRADPNIVEGLTGKTVAVIGCGSLGSSVARMLVQSGLRRLILVDPERLRWENIGRHELGAEAVNQPKASALAKHLRTRFPHLETVRAEDTDWRCAFRNDPSIFESCDLVLSATGDWNVESALNDLHCDGELTCPVVYGWMEERAAAAHALAVGMTGSCLRCGFGSTGTALIAATGWPDGDEVAECGGGTSVYGAIELANAHAVVSGLVTDILLDRAALPARRTWLVPKPILESVGGVWNSAWSKAFGDPGFGGCLIATPWPQRDGCPSCSGTPK